ncbi:AraC family transcriptional regulator [Coprococcus sp. AF99-45]|jgi:AraC-like DNA-binding protein|uniref:AraC family transcriptional regulator n=1 Tax=Coprococcus sp. AF99-45 TaxID=2997948 RepID=UPI0006DCDB34|nr:AraC family transcriptional regulator [Coprococcus sp. AF99-45]
MKMQITEIITDETLREIREHGTPEFPFEYYLDDIDEIGQGYVEWHWHNEIEWAWVESGKVICRIGNEKIILEAGEGIFINSRVIHRFETPGGALMPNILHAPELLAARESAIYQKYVSPVITYGKEYVILEKEKNSGILSLLDEIYKDAGKEMLRKELIIQNKISRLWDELFEEVPDIVQRESRNKNLLLQSRLREMMQFIENHYKERISLERLAAEANISKSEALRCFKRGIGTTPVKYLIDYRLERAKELLCKTNDTIIRVAADVGIDNTSYFVRIFKKMYGMTPGAFREEEGLKKAGEK